MNKNNKKKMKKQKKMKNKHKKNKTMNTNKNKNKDKKKMKHELTFLSIHTSPHHQVPDMDGEAGHVWTHQSRPHQLARTLCQQVLQ